MDGIKHSGRFAEMERLVNDYFNCHIAPIMSKTRADLIRNQGEEMKEYSTSLGGILSMMASSAQPMSDPYQALKVTGEWNSKTTEDYIEMCKTEITGSEEMQQDLAYMAGQWRDTVVQEIGRARYNELSEQLGCDLAYAYMDHRIEELMIDRLVKERMPKSSADYIIRKAAESSLLGLSQTLSRSPLTDEIEARGEAAYRPNRWEKGTGWMLGTAADTLMMGGTGSWTALAKFTGADVAIAAITNHFEGKKPDTLSVEQCISKGVFGRDRNVFDDFRKEAAQIQIKENTAIGTDNKQLKKKIPVMDFDFMEWTQNQNSGLLWPNVQSKEEQKHEERYKGVPIVVAPGQEEAYLQSLEQRDKAKMVRTEQDEIMKEEKHETVVPANDAEQHVQTIQSAQVAQGNGNGWGGLLGMLGLDGIGNITGNLGYVMAMLPDVLLGIFTGKTESLHLGDNMLPIASIVAGMFVRNPLLKMLLIGLGGMNLLNKAGHEALKERTEGKLNVTNENNVQYRRYTNETLNPRIVNPVLQDSTLIATIDRVPCTIQLSPIVAEAYRTGALPLNTLANAVLAKNDQLRQAAARNYEDGKLETIVRPRGIQ